MFEKTTLSTSEKQIISNFYESIDGLSIGNDDKIYLSYFIKSILDENFIAAAPSGFIFIEKLIRTELILHRTRKAGNEKDFLSLLDEIEDELENGDRGGNNIKALFESCNSKICSYGVITEIKREEIIRSINDYLDIVDKEGPLPQLGLSFNQICKELMQEKLIDKDFSKKLKSFYSKYRNVVQHGLFKRLFDLYFKSERTSVIGGNILTGNIETYNPMKSNLLFRQFAIEPIFKDVCIETFDILQELLYIFGRNNIKK